MAYYPRRLVNKRHLRPEERAKLDLLARAGELDDGTPVFFAERVSEHQLMIWHPDCGDWHFHGAASDGPRAPHCRDFSRRGRHYVLQIVSGGWRHD